MDKEILNFFAWLTSQTWWDIGTFSLYEFINKWLPTILSIAVGYWLGNRKNIPHISLKYIVMIGISGQEIWTGVKLQNKRSIQEHINDCGFILKNKSCCYLKVNGAPGLQSISGILEANSGLSFMAYKSEIDKIKNEIRYMYYNTTNGFHKKVRLRVK